MSFKASEKISEIISYAVRVFKSKNNDNTLNDARKVGEAICKALIYNYYGDTRGNDVILGKVGINGNPIIQPRELDFKGLINIVCESNSRYAVISYHGTRSRVKSYLEVLRVHGNPASHNINNPEDKMDTRHVCIITSTLYNLLMWVFIDYFHVELPEQLSPYIKQYTEASELVATASESRLSKLKIDLQQWFKALNYQMGKLNIDTDDFVIFTIKIPERRKLIDVLIYVITSEIKIEQIDYVSDLIKNYDCDEGWVITDYIVGKAARDFLDNKDNPDVFCYTFDELIEETIDFSKYFDWIQNQIIEKGIDKYYIQLACEKLELHSKTKKIMAKNIYDENDGWIEGYIDIWMEDEQKEHISILGEFGTGKTWFTLHYTWKLIEKYNYAKDKRLTRPRIPIFIQLRDFSKALNVDVLISDFFFRKHNIDIVGAFNAFKQLNRMGKLLFIFDGFDEMADKINKQKMIDNFWEIASIIDRNSKVILTCRNEHFPQIKEGRSLLSAELRESTKYLTGENPQFEVLQLLKLNDKQIKQILLNHTNDKTISSIFKNNAIVDLLKRPIMTDLIIDALKEIEEDKKVDLSRIYLYAITRKMKRDIKQERTFTSLADKLYFLCELSWEMIASDKLTINYKEFPNVVNNLFAHKVKDAELDYWRYDMRGQTILIIDEEDGNYKPAHKSFLEFFVAYKFAAQLGVLSKDFTEVSMNQSNLDESTEAKEYAWSEYFNRRVDKQKEIIRIAKLKMFKTEELNELIRTAGKLPFSKAIVDLITGMINLDSLMVQEKLLQIINLCRGKGFEEVNYLASNIVLILLNFNNSYFAGKDLSNLCLRELRFYYDRDFRKKQCYNFEDTNFENSDLTKCSFGNDFSIKNGNNFANANFKNTNLQEFKFYHFQIDDVAVSENNDIIAIGSCNDLIILRCNTLQVICRENIAAWHIKFLKNDEVIVHSGYGYFDIRSTSNLQLEYRHIISKRLNKEASEPENTWTGGFEYSSKTNLLYIACNNSYIYIFDLNRRKEIEVLECFYGCGDLSLSFNEKYLVSFGFHEVIIWDLQNYKKIYYIKEEEKDDLTKYNAKFHPMRNEIVITGKDKVVIYDISTSKYIFQYVFKDCRNIDFSADGTMLCITSGKQLAIFNYNTKELIRMVDIDKIVGDLIDSQRLRIKNTALTSDGRTLYVILDSHDLIVIDIVNMCITGRYLHMYDLTNCDFSQVRNLHVSIKEQLIKNGVNLKY